MKLPLRDLEEITSRVSKDEDPLFSGSLLLTGGSGFVGRWMIESFVHARSSLGARGRMTVLSRRPSSLLGAAPHLAGDPSLVFLEGDLRFLRPDALAPGMPERCDAVIHLASESSRDLSTLSPRRIVEAIESTDRLLEYAVRAGARRFLFASSGAVYGPQPPDLERLPEEYPTGPDVLDPSSAYGEVKRASELLCAVYRDRHGLEVVVARGFAFLGPLLPLDRGFAAGNFLRNILERRPIEITGDGTPCRSYLYAGDLAAWLWAILARGAPGRAYNVGSEHDVTVAELAREVAELLEPRLPIVIHRLPRPGAPPERYVPSTARARSELGVQETVDRRSALRRTFDWYRDALAAATSGGDR